MEPLCFEGYYRKRFARVKEFSCEQVEVVLDKFLGQFCNRWLEEEFELQSGAKRYERTGRREDYRTGHYRRELLTARGRVHVNVPRGKKIQYTFSLFKKFKRKTEQFESVVIEALLKGHSSRKASQFFEKLFGAGTISHQAAVMTLRKFDGELQGWKSRSIRDNAVILVLDAVWLKGVIPYLKGAKPVLFAYAVYADGQEEVLDFELAQGESQAAWCRFCQILQQRGLTNVRLIVRDDNEAIKQAAAFVWPNALDQACVFHVMQNFTKKLTGCRDKRKLIDDASRLYEAKNEEEFYRLAQKFKRRWLNYRYHPAIKYLFDKLADTIKYFGLPEKFWHIAKTTNRLERLFEELKRRIRVFRRFPNPASCSRWLYALLTQQKRWNNPQVLCESQQSS
jgi:putative transposase